MILQPPVISMASRSPNRIPRKPVSPPQKHDQNRMQDTSPVRGRKPLPESAISYQVQTQTARRSPVRVHVQPDESSFPTGYAAEFNDVDMKISRRFSYEDEYHFAQEEPVNQPTRPPQFEDEYHLAQEEPVDQPPPPPHAPPPPPPHFQGVSRNRDFEKSSSEEFPMPGKFPKPSNTPQITDEVIAVSRNHHKSSSEGYPMPGQFPFTSSDPQTPKEKVDLKMSENRRPSLVPPNRDIYGDTYYIQDLHDEIKNDSGMAQPRYHSTPRLPLPPQQSRHASTPQPQPRNPNADDNRNLMPYVQDARQQLDRMPRPSSSGSAFSDTGPRGHSSGGLDYIPQPPGLRVRSEHSRAPFQNRSNDSRPTSYVELNTSFVSNPISLFPQHRSLEMYQQSLSKNSDPEARLQFAILLMRAAHEAESASFSDSSSDSLGNAKKSEGKENQALEIDLYTDVPAKSARDLLAQAAKILKHLSDSPFPDATYLLADGYENGTFAKGKKDHSRAFPLFISASKRGHAEASFRAAICYQDGKGCRKDAGNAIEYFRLSASRGNLGAMTRLGKSLISGDLGYKDHREGVKWLTLAAQNANNLFNSAPYDLGCLYEYGDDRNVFKDEAYAAQLFTKAAELGNAEAAYRLGLAYELGELSCPRDPLLSIHFYTKAAMKGYAPAMMGICGWCTLGVDGVLEQSNEEAFEWAKRAAKKGHPRGEYTLGFFYETGRGCRPDPMEAMVWYRQASADGYDDATRRLRKINGAAEGELGNRRNPFGGRLAAAISSPNLNSRVHSRGSSSIYVDQRPVSAGNRESSYGQNLTVPGQNLYRQPEPLDGPQGVKSGGPRFSLGESPQRPKRGVLRKKRGSMGLGDGFDEDMSSVSSRSREGDSDFKKGKGGWFGWMG